MCVLKYAQNKFLPVKIDHLVYTTSSFYLFYELHMRKYEIAKLCQNFHQKVFVPTLLSQYFETPKRDTHENDRISNVPMQHQFVFG